MQAPAKNQTRSDAGLENSCGANPPACFCIMFIEVNQIISQSSKAGFLFCKNRYFLTIELKNKLLLLKNSVFLNLYLKGGG